MIMVHAESENSLVQSSGSHSDPRYASPVLEKNRGELDGKFDFKMTDSCSVSLRHAQGKNVPVSEVEAGRWE